MIEPQSKRGVQQNGETPNPTAANEKIIGREYDFYGRLKEKFPSQVIVDVTEMCNLACAHCAHSQFKKSKYYSKSSLSAVLSAKLVDEVRRYGKNVTQYIRYCAEGEPLIHPYIYEMLEYAVQKSGVAINLTTNGTLLSRERIERLLAIGINVIDISIDAFTPETYAKIRLNGDFNVTRANVLTLVKTAKQTSSRTKIVVSYIQQPQNIHETKSFEKFWKDNGIDYVVIRRMHSTAGALTSIADRMRKDNMDRPRRPCVYPWERIVLNPRGYLSFCPADWTHGSSITDYRTTTVYESWQSEFYHKLREAHLTNSFTNYNFCEQCPDWVVTHWPNEGRSYANMIEELKECQ